MPVRIVTALRFEVFELAGRQAVLAGADNGRALLAKLIAQTPRVDEVGPCFLDFSTIDLATFSFVRESVFGYRDYTRSSMPNLYPVIANAGPRALEEIAA